MLLGTGRYDTEFACTRYVIFGYHYLPADAGAEILHDDPVLCPSGGPVLVQPGGPKHL